MPLVQEAIRDAEILFLKKKQQNFTFSHVSVMANYSLHTVTVVILDIFLHERAVPSFSAAIHRLYIVIGGMANPACN